MAEAMDRTKRSTTTVSLRIPEAVRDLIDAAAAAAGKTRTEFMLDSARQQAIETLLDQRLFALEDEAYDAFKSVLEDPPKANAELRRLASTKAPWER